MDDYLTKPIRSDKLAETLGRWLSTDTQESDQAGASDEPASPVAVLDPKMIEQLRWLEEDGTNEIMSELAEAFREAALGTYGEIEQAISAGDAASLRFCAHRLQSEARTWGATDLNHLLGELERREIRDCRRREHEA